MKKPETYIVVMLVAAVFIGVNLFAAYSIYTRVAQPEKLPANRATSATDADALAVTDLQALLKQNSVRRNSYQVISDKNLFSPQRTAWQPPVKDLDPTQEKIAPKLRRRDVVLCGIFRIGDKKGAILEFPALNSKQRKRTLYVGDTATSELDQHPKVYVLEKIAHDSVTIKDYNGVVFSVSLYDGKKDKRRVTVAATTSVTVDAATAPSQKPTVVSVGTDRATAVQKIAKQRAASARLEQKVKQGKLKKVQTPFGTAYLKNNKPATMESKKR